MTKVKEQIFKTYTVTLPNARTFFGMGANETFLSLTLMENGIVVVSNTVNGVQETRMEYLSAYNDVKTALGFVIGEEIDSITLSDPIVIISRRRTL